MREEFKKQVELPDGDPNALTQHLAAIPGVGPAAAHQAGAYLLSAYRALGTLPTQSTLVIERFFDESGGMQLVIHSPFGSRLNRAWGLALRKRFCRAFNFELQAAAIEDAIVISLGAVHSFQLEDVWRYLNAETVREILIPGAVGCAHVYRTVALGGELRAGHSALPRRAQSSAAPAAHASRRPGRGGLSGPARVRRKSQPKP